MTMHNRSTSSSTSRSLWAFVSGVLLAFAAGAAPATGAQTVAAAFSSVAQADAQVAPVEAQARPASTLIVSVTGVSSDEGTVGCALYDDAEGFPTDRSRMQSGQEVAARRSGVTCRFENVAPGTYALAVVHDKNENGRTDRNLLGLPTEAWGVSNGVRPRMRAPRFDEAAFSIRDGVTTRLSITLD
ncbi:MAG: DUF2141 domain-containing protein [Bacteroidota bacterium]